MNNPPAFPKTVDGTQRQQDGMSLRDYFAAATMQGYITLQDDRTCPKDRLNDVEAWRKEIRLSDAEYCYSVADAMLDAREKQSK